MIIWLLRIFSAVALAGFATAVWYAGPLVGFADGRPLESASTRAMVIAAAATILAAYYLFRFWRTGKAQRALEAALAKAADADSDAPVLEERMNEALATLKATSRRRNFLYELPWYVIIGPPGAGKTTALVNSGLKFPLAGSGAAQPVAGIGGTRNCDWWFTDEAVLIDTAGRYTTQDSDAAADKKGWLAFLSLLKKNRPRQPINGVIVAISLTDLMTRGGHELGAHVIEIRNRLQEIHETLKIEFPVYVLFTKADLVLGFMEYFNSFDEARRRQVWGVTFQAADRQQNMAGEAPAEFDALVKRLSEETTDRVQEEADPVARILIFDFAAQFGGLKERITDFLGRIFEPQRQQASAALRGFYFSSGTQEGTPIDRILGAIGRSFGSSARPQLSGAGKSFFLHDLLAKVVFAESGWVSHDRSGDRRKAFVRSAGLALVTLAAVAVLGAMAVSFATNRALITATGGAVKQYRAMADPGRSATVADVDLENVIGALDTLRGLPVGYDNSAMATPIEETLGFSQRGRLLSASETAYRLALERMFRSRLLLQLEQTIEANMADPAALYEPLKIYLMLAGKAPKVDDPLVVAWMKRDWQQNRYPGSHNREGREQLEKHLRALLALDDRYDPLYDVNRPLVELGQRSLGRMSLADRASALLKSATDAAAPSDFSVSARGGAEAALIFEATDGSELSTLRLPGIYTYAGFHDVYLQQLADIAQQLVDDQWVIGPGGEQGSAEQDLLRLGPDLLDRYGKDFAAAWNGLLDRLKLKTLSADKPQYLALSAAASPTSPIRRLFEAIAYETALTREPEAGAGSEEAQDGAAVPEDQAASAAGDRARGLARIGITLPGGKDKSRAGAAFADSAGQDPGAAIEAQFRPFQAVVSGTAGQRPIDVLVQNFRDIHQSLLLSDSMKSQGDRVNTNLQLQIASLRANASRLPKPLARMAQAAADDFEGEAAETSITTLNRLLGEAVRGPCEAVVANRFPFAASSAEDVPMEDFAKLFAPSGVIDRFFAQNLSSLVDVSGQTWQWNQNTRVGRELSRSALEQFQRAAEIRDAFFPAGGTTPSVTLTFTPFSLHGDADMALLDVNGQIVQSNQTGNTPGTMTWPGGGPSNSASLSLTPELPGRASAIKFDGSWALKRLLDAGSTTSSGENLEVRFLIGGRDVAYTIQAGPAGNPFSLPALGAFACPGDF